VNQHETPTTFGTDVPREPRALFELALSVPAAQRHALLANARAVAPDAAAEVESLLEFHDAEAGVLDLPPPLADARSVASSMIGSVPPTIAPPGIDPGAARPRLGNYTIVRELGAGGMGTVYEAVQDAPKRTVALKVIRAGVLSDSLVRRFAQESEALARLAHPGIAQIFEAGVARGEGWSQPFIAMELVRGVPITQFVKDHDLSTRDRLDLFARVCDAVDHAHRRGVVHRDLKPANILVADDEADSRAEPSSHASGITTRDGTGTGSTTASGIRRASRIGGIGVPKILDFGVARLTDSNGQSTPGQTIFNTGPGQIIGTLSYMSPEQASGEPSTIDERSDVYALGVILYELLSGQLPHNLERAPVAQALSVIDRVDPKPLGSIARHLRGDLDTITMRALEKDRARRYQSAAELASEIRRYLADQPIAARPPSTMYELLKFAKRNRGLVAAVVAVIIALSAGIVATGVQWRNAVANEAYANQISEFLRKTITSVDPSQAKGAEPTVREMLDSAAADLEAAELPVRARSKLMMELSTTYVNLGKYADGERLARRALELAVPDEGKASRTALRAAGTISHSLYEQNRFREGVELMSEYVEAARAAGMNPENRDLRRLTTSLAIHSEALGDFDAAEKLYRNDAELSIKLDGENSIMGMIAMSNFGVFLMDRGKLQEAESWLRRADASARAALPPGHPNLAVAISNLGAVNSRLGNHAECERLSREAIAISTKTEGPDHASTLQYEANLASALLELGRHDEMQPVIVPLVERCEKFLGPDDRRTTEARALLAKLRFRQKRLDEAAAIGERAYQGYAAVFGDRSDKLTPQAEFMVLVHEARGEPEKVAQWRERVNAGKEAEPKRTP
jgi:eukaryotic-like serine/threonine-protein kinase